MASPIFNQTARGKRALKNVPKANTTNKAGGKAYKFTDKHALAQYCLTGTFNGTFYSNAQTQLDEVIKLSAKVSPEYIASLAVYAREHGHMKDTPAFLLAVLANRDIELFKRSFNQVVDNGKMLRNFVQIIRSGATGRKSFGTAIKKTLQNWLNARTDYQIFHDSVGNTPSLSDVIKMVRPKPANKKREVLYAYVTDKLSFKKSAKTIICTKSVPAGRGKFKDVRVKTADIPDCIKSYEKYKLTGTGEVPKVPFQLLTALNLGTKEWSAIADNAKWQMTRMNLNTFQRHGVFDNKKMVNSIATRLADRENVLGAKAFPYQLFTSYKYADASVPHKVRDSLQDAMEHAIENVPEIDGEVTVCVDVSGSMGCAVTGNRPGATSKMTYVDVAGLITSAIMRKNPSAKVIAFNHSAQAVHLNSRDSVMTNAQKIANLLSGGTDCSAPIQMLNQTGDKSDLIVMVSDNESWHGLSGGRYRGYWGNSGTDMMAEWTKFKKRNPNAKLVNIDIEPNGNSQTKSSDDVLNIAGFSDICFSIINAFARGALANDALVETIEAVSIDGPNQRAKQPIKVRVNRKHRMK